MSIVTEPAADLLEELRRNNNRSLFLAHKTDCERLVAAPLHELLAAAEARYEPGG